MESAVNTLLNCLCGLGLVLFIAACAYIRHKNKMAYASRFWEAFDRGGFKDLLRPRTSRKFGGYVIAYFIGIVLLLLDLLLFSLAKDGQIHISGIFLEILLGLSILMILVGYYVMQSEINKRM